MLSELYNFKVMAGQVGPAEREAVLLRELDHITQRLEQIRRDASPSTSST
jgi:hypothetical protein